MSETHSLVGKAMRIARTAHEGQQYTRGGEPRPFFDAHVLPVASLVSNWGAGERTYAAALLHDTLEETDLTPEALREQGIPEDVIEVVEALTWDKKREKQGDYLSRVCAVPQAVLIKYADTKRNIEATEEGRGGLSREEYARLQERYKRNLEHLAPHLPNDGVI